MYKEAFFKGFNSFAFLLKKQHRYHDLDLAYSSDVSFHSATSVPINTHFTVHSIHLKMQSSALSFTAY